MPLAGVTWVLFIGEQAWAHARTLITGVPLRKADNAPHAEAV
jgi:hypothetical protein